MFMFMFMFMIDLQMPASAFIFNEKLRTLLGPFFANQSVMVL